MLSEVWVSAAQLLEAQTVIETLADQEALEGDDDAQADASDHADFDIVCAHCGTPATAEARVCELCGQPLPD